MLKVYFLSLSILFIIVAGCNNNNVDLEKEKEIILQTIETARQGLLEKDINKVLATEAPGNEVIFISNGKIGTYNYEQSKEVYENQFESGDFTSIKELVEPIIDLSPDGKMAWIASKWEFTSSYTDSLGEKKETITKIAGLAILKKENDKWISIVESQSDDED